MRRAGFTLIELLMAMAFFSFMMAILSIGVLQIMNIYQANVASRRTQAAARTAMEDITREVRNSSTVQEATTDRLCLEGSRPVEYRRSSDRLYKRTGGASCTNLTGSTEIEMIGTTGTSDANSNLKIRAFTASEVADSGGDDASVRVSLTVTTGADDLISGTACTPGVTGSQFCSATEYSNTVSLRGKSGG